MEAELLDCDVGWVTQRHLIERLLTRHYDVIVAWSASVADVPATVSLFQLTKELSPETKVMAYGDGPIYVARLFRHFQFDAIFASGDPELAITNYLRYLRDPSSGPRVGVPNVEILADGRYLAPGAPEFARPEEWGFPPSTRFRSTNTRVTT